MTYKVAIRETPFCVVCGTEVVTVVEVEANSLQIHSFDTNIIIEGSKQTYYWLMKCEILYSLNKSLTNRRKLLSECDFIL